MIDSNLKVFAVLLAGGSGTRLWPVSRELFPKQLVPFFGNEPLIQNTVKRLLPVFEADHIRVVCGQKHAHEIMRGIQDTGFAAEGKIIVEPCGRNTAPAILLAILKILRKEKDAAVFVFPADHLIENIPDFHAKIKTALELVKQDYIVTFGITPSYPETGYGYIEASGTKIDEAFSIKRFVEKPDLKTAQTYLRAGTFYWNSGMFAFKASLMLTEFQKSRPKILTQMQSMVSAGGHLNVENYSQIENISFDFAIMENTAKGIVLPSDFGWSDIGSWKSLYDFMPKDKDHNVNLSDDAILQNTRNSFVMGSGRLIAVNHLENIVVVETPDSVFVSDLENSRDVKSIVSTLKENGRKEYQIHTTVNKPWGYYKILDSENNITLRRIVLYKDAEIQEQTHTNRAKQWLVVEGTAKVAINQDSRRLEEKQSIQIPPNKTVSLLNTGPSELKLIEVERVLK
jgi:mannose-1-phosphate guanylyltransferase/mannose-6-phosphate isomerase